MAIGAFGRNRNEDTEVESAPAPVESRPSQLVSALIDQGSRCEGKLFFRDAVRIDGTFSGEITSENTLIIGESGEVHAEVRSARVIVSGTVVGNIHASAQIVFHKSARVEGDLTTPSLLMETGAVFKGHVDMGSVDKSESPAVRKIVSPINQKSQQGAASSASPNNAAEAKGAKAAGSSRDGNKATAS